MFAFVAFNGVDDGVDATGISAQPAVDARGVARHGEDGEEPDGGEGGVDQQHGAKEGVIHLIEFFHRRLVCRTADPAASEGGEAAPDVFAVHPVRGDEVEDGEADDAAKHDGERRREKHRQHFPAEADELRHVHGKRHEKEAGGEEVGGGKAVNLFAEAGGEDAGAVEACRDEAAEDDAGDDGVKAAPEGVGAVASSEDEADDAHDEAEGSGQGGDKRGHVCEWIKREDYCNRRAIILLRQI